MKPDDEKLKQLLQSVDVPSDLKSRLRAIPELPQENAATHVTPKREQPRSRKKLAVILAFAASMGAIGLYAGWPATQESNAPIARNNTPPVTDPIGNANVAPIELSDSRRLLNEITASATEISNFATQLEIDRLSIEAEIIERTSQQAIARNAYRNLSRRESASLSLALTQQSALKIGVDEAIVKRDLQNVMAKFPGTRGAKLAEQILATEL